jgi:hypothetical protein
MEQTTVELKAKAYDLVVMIEKARQDLTLINQELDKRNKQKNQAKAED